MCRRAAVLLTIALTIFLTASAASQAVTARTTDSAASPFMITRIGDTYQAESASSGQIYTGTLKAVMESAVTNLNGSGGGSVIFSAGVFDFGSEYFKIHNLVNITFQGQGIDVTVVQNSSTAAADTEPFNFSGTDNVTIKDLTVSALGSVRLTSDAIDFDRGNNSVVERVKVAAARGRGIVFDGKNIINGVPWTSQNNVIRDCVVNGVPGDGIEFLAATNNVVERCTVTNTGAHGIQATKSSSQTGNAQPNKKASDNIIRNNVIDNAGRDGININASDRNRIEGNRITNSGNAASSDGIRLNSSDSITCDDNVVDGNVATDNQATKTQRYGLHISSSLCNRTVVGFNNDFSGNRLAPIRDIGTNTQYQTAPDVTPPTVPGNVQATAVSHARIDLSWTASTDDVAVSHYTIRRGGQVLTAVGGGSTSYSDTSVSPSTTYAYTVEAVDTSGKVSGESSPPAIATTPATPSSFTINPEADAYVNESSPANNYGNSTSLRADGSPVNRSYLRFTVSGVGTISSVKLRVFANTGSNAGHDVRGVSDNSWTESGINFTNSPAVGSVIGSSGSFSAGIWTEVNVTSYVTGNGTYTLALTTPSSTAISYASKESASDPQLVITTGAGDTQPPSVPGNVQATAVNHARIDLSWTASTDDVGVDHYTIRRGGQVLTTVGGAATSYSDTTVQASTLYSYTVEAVDAAGHPSGQSLPATATTPAAPASQTFLPEADAYVNESSPLTNYGAATTLRADASPVNRSYLRFTVQGVSGTISSVKLRIFANTASSIGHDIRGVTDTTWVESGINFSNSPAVGAVIGSMGPFTAGTWTEVDVSSYVTGNGTYTLALTSTSSTAVSYGSRESSNDPQLLVST